MAGASASGEVVISGDDVSEATSAPNSSDPVALQVDASGQGQLPGVVWPVEAGPGGNKAIRFALRRGALFNAFAATRIGGTRHRVEMRLARQVVTLVTRRAGELQGTKKGVVCEADIPLAAPSTIVAGGAIVVSMADGLFADLLCGRAVQADDDTQLMFEANLPTGEAEGAVGAVDPQQARRSGTWQIKVGRFDIEWPFSMEEPTEPNGQLQDGQRLRPDVLRDAFKIVHGFAVARGGQSAPSRFRNVEVTDGRAMAASPTVGGCFVEGLDLADVSLRVACEHAADLRVVLARMDPADAHLVCADGTMWLSDGRIRCSVPLQDQGPPFETLLAMTGDDRASVDGLSSCIGQILSQLKRETEVVQIVLDGDEHGTLTFSADVVTRDSKARRLVEGVDDIAKVVCPVFRTRTNEGTEPFVRHEVWLTAATLSKFNPLQDPDRVELCFLGTVLSLKQSYEGRTVRTFLIAERIE